MKYILLLTYLALGSAFIPVFLAILKFKMQPKALKLLSAFIVFNAMLEVVNFIVVKLKINSLPMHHFYTMIELSIAMIISIMIIYPSAKKPHLLIIIPLIVTSIGVIDIIYIESLEAINSIPRVIQGLSMIGVSVLFFYKIFNAEEQVDILRFPYFWLYTAWLIYFSGTFFLFVYSYKTGMTITYPIIHSVLYIILNLVYTYVLWLGSRKSIS